LLKYLTTGRGVKILMSMGGATVKDCGESCGGKYRIDSAEEANQTAEIMHNMFFSGIDKERPFGSVQLDGVDLDIGVSLVFPDIDLYTQRDIDRGYRRAL
jgi:hypothetical protein